MPAPILASVLALALWTHVMWSWMYVTRLPAIGASKMKLDPNAPRGEQMATLPARVRWKADNYNHLMEQPTVFYAVALVTAVVAPTDAVAVIMAWVYVALRVAHSVLQALVNIIPLRFALFALSSIALIALTVRTAIAFF
ncbi:MAG: MAPEG family protein [Deltaproteobacteria bacterium]|jgi:hypothetical protein|nr:MAPEG family protein [Deltaproteobacteria bacterium]